MILFLNIKIYDYSIHFIIFIYYKVDAAITTTTSKASTTKGKLVALFLTIHFITLYNKNLENEIIKCLTIEFISIYMYHAF